MIDESLFERASGNEHWTFIVVTPDGVASGALDRVFDCVSKAGFGVKSCRSLPLTIAAMHGVYHHAPPPEESAHLSDMFDKLYGVAPACLLMLTHELPSACDALLACKGRTRPEEAERCTIRFTGENVILNHVHCPDTPALAVEELIWLVGRRRAEELLQVTLSSPVSVLAPLLDARALRAGLPAEAGTDAISFPSILNKVHRRLLTVLAFSGYSVPELHATMVAAHAALEAQSNSRKYETARERLLAARPGIDEIQRLLSGLAGNLKNAAIVNGLRSLQELSRLSGERDFGAILNLRLETVWISPLEQVAIEAHGHAFVPGSVLDRIYSEADG